MPRLVSRAELARIAGVSRATVTELCKQGSLVDAVEGKHVDLDHPAARAYLERRGVSPEDISSLANFGEGSSEDLAELASILSPLTERFGTEPAFKEWLDALKKIEEIREKRLKNEALEGELISRELVKTHVFGAIESSNRRLLSDTPKTIARRLYAAAKADEPVEEAEKVVRELISSQLRPVKDTAARVLRNA